MTIRIHVSHPLDAEARFAVMDAIADILKLYGKHPKSIGFVNVPQAGAVA